MSGDVRALYTATERFDPSSGSTWDNYVAWSELSQLIEVVSLDDMLCSRLIKEVLPEDWPHLVAEDYLNDYFTDLEYLLRRIEPAPDANVLCVFQNPDSAPSPPGAHFRLEGYELIETTGGTSALLNCGGFPDAFEGSELSSNGLLASLDRARDVQAALRAVYPDEPHAQCDIWAIFRRTRSSER